MNAPTPIRTQTALRGLDSPNLGGLPPGPVTATELAAAVPDAADRRRYVRIWHGMYRHEKQPDDLWLRSRALARTFPDGVLRGRSAALLWGEDSVPQDALPEIWLPATRKSCPGRVYRYGALPHAAITEVHGLRVTTPLRTCRDLAVELPFADAVLAVERMCVAQPGLAPELAAAVAHPAGSAGDRAARRRARQVAAVVEAIDPQPVAVDISRARSLLVAAGIEGFGYGHEVRIDGRTRVLPLGDPVSRCVVVTEGGRGASAELMCDERARQLLRRAGWTLVVVNGPAVEDEPEGVAGIDEVDVVRTLRSRWPASEVLGPLDGGSASDPHGIWVA